MYGVREVERLLRMPRALIRSLVNAGFVSPARGPRRAWRFSFQDLIALRTAQSLFAAGLPPRRITSALRELRRKAESGQYPLAFGGDPATSDLKVIERKPADGFELHQTGKLADAERAYKAALEADGDDPLLHYNLGVLLEDMGRKGEALESYRAALKRDPRMADCHYNIALLYENAGKPRDAIRHMAQYRKLTRQR